MINQRQKFYILLLIPVILSFGCWDRRELDELALATCVGIDQVAEAGEVEFSVEIVIPENISTPGGGGGTGPSSHLLQSQGKTVFDAVRKMTLESEEKIYFAHNPVLLFGIEVAESGLLPYLDFFVRDQEARRTPWLLVTEGKTPEIISVRSFLGPYTGIYIQKLVEEIESNSLVAQSNMQNFMDKLISPTRSPYCSIIKVKGDDKNKSLELVGTAIFKKDKMVGKFDFKEGRGLLWVVGEVKSGIITVPCEKDKEIAQWIVRSKSKIIPTIENKTLKVTVEVTESGTLGEMQCTVDPSESGALKSIEKRQAEVIRQEIIAAVKKAQELNADVFGFGEAFHRKYPTLWREELEKAWDDFFPHLDVEVIVQCKIKRTGMITKPIIGK